VAAPGWYANPDGRRGLRYWDGSRWTEHTHGVGSDIPATADSGTADHADEMPPPPGVGVACFAFGAGAAVAIAVAALLAAASHPGGDILAFCLTELALWSGMVAGVVYVSRRRGTGNLAHDFGWRLRRADLGIGAIGAIVGRSTTVVVAIPLYAAFHELLRNPSVGLPARELTPGLFAAYAVAACVGAPVIEELFFRGLVQTRLVWRWGAVRGIVVTSVLFGAAHLIGWRGPASVLAATAIAAGGVVLGYLRYRTGRLGTSTVAHALFNAFAVLLLGLGVGR